MPKRICVCGEVLHYSDIPNKIEHLFISDFDYEKFEGPIDAEELYMKMKSFFKCPKCGRLWFFWDGFDNKPIEYIPVEE